jgi:hypothetical protein
MDQPLREHERAMRDYLEGASGALLLGLLLAVFAFAGPVAGMALAGVVGMAVIIVLLLRLADGRGH